MKKKCKKIKISFENAQLFEQQHNGNVRQRKKLIFVRVFKSKNCKWPSEQTRVYSKAFKHFKEKKRLSPNAQAYFKQITVFILNNSRTDYEILLKVPHSVLNKFLMNNEKMDIFQWGMKKNFMAHTAAVLLLNQIGGVGERGSEGCVFGNFWLYLALFSVCRVADFCLKSSH